MKHRDTEKEKNMFATLIIQLPSIYTGGEVVVYHDDKCKKKYDLGQKSGKSERATYYAAHFADLNHEVLEVRSGFRLVLVYSLCWSEADSSGFVASGENLLSVKKMAYALQHLDDSKRYLSMLLDHKYTPNSVETNGVKALKGVDNERFKLLKYANSRLPDEHQYDFYIAHANLVVLNGK